MSHETAPRNPLSLDTVAIHVLRAMILAREDHRTPTLDDLARDVGVRRADVRSTLSALHREGFVDVLRMRPTLAGFALGRAAAGASLRTVRSRAAAPALDVAAA